MSVLIAFECMCRDPKDATGLSKHLISCIRDCVSALEHWDLRRTEDDDVLESRAAEHRAMKRAQAGVLRAQHLSEQNQLDDEQALRLQLDCFRRAAWPSGEELDEESQISLLERIESGELVDLEVDSEAGGLNAPGVASLSALAERPELGALPFRPSGSTESGSSGSGSRSWSSWASFTELESAEPKCGWFGGKAGAGRGAGFGALAQVGALSLREQAARGALAERLNSRCKL